MLGLNHDNDRRARHRDRGAGVRAGREPTAHRAEANVLQAAVAWADQHPAESIHDAATWVPGGEQATAIAGPGAPLVAEFCVAEFALAIGGSTDAGRALIGQAVELAYRLPKIWARDGRR